MHTVCLPLLVVRSVICIGCVVEAHSLAASMGAVPKFDELQVVVTCCV